jgi:hypothetical protein
VASDLKGWDIFRNPKWILDNLLAKYKVIRVPTNAGWVSVVVGSGALGYEPLCMYLHTGTTASSSARFYHATRGLNSGDINYDRVDWLKKLELSFLIVRYFSDAEVKARFQLKESYTEGILAQRGIGVSIDNYAMVGEAYGTARGTVSLGTLTDFMVKRIKIVIVPSTRVEFWVDDVLTGTLTGTAVPSIQGTAAGYLVASIINGTTGGVDAYLFVGDIIITQEW